jgi:hypothetical protein
MNDGWPTRRTVIAGLAAAAGFSREVVAQAQSVPVPGDLKIDISPQHLRSRGDRFVFSFETPDPIDGLSPTRHIELFACVLKRDQQTGAPLEAYKKKIFETKDLRGTARLSPQDFLAPHEQIIELIAQADGEYSFNRSLNGKDRASIIIEGEPEIPRGFGCDQVTS